MGVSTLSFLVMLLVKSNEKVSSTTRFLLSNQIKSANTTPLILFSNPQNTVPTHLCIDSTTSQSTLSLLSHHVCQTYGFPTYSHIAEHNTSTQGLVRSSQVVCLQDTRGDYSISCSRKDTFTSSCSLLEVTCGPCYHHLQLRTDSSLLLQSPLYPVLQPGLVCQWDLSMPAHHTVNLQLQNLHMFPAHLDPDHGSQCVDSFLHLLEGDSPEHMASLATLCGDLQKPQNFSLRSSKLKIQLVSGQLTSVRGQKGFTISVKVSSVLVSKLEPSRLILIPVLTLGLLFMFGFLLLLLTYLASESRKRRVMRPGRSATWHGAVPRPGQSLHQARTERMSRLVRDTMWDLGNIYSRNLADLGNIYSRNLADVGSRQLPDIPRERDEPGPREERRESSRIYESMSFVDDRDLSLATQNIAASVRINSETSLHSSITFSLSSEGRTTFSPVVNSSSLSSTPPSRPYCSKEGPLSPDYLSLLSYLFIPDSSFKGPHALVKETRSVSSLPLRDPIQRLRTMSALPLCEPIQRLRTRLSSTGKWKPKLSSMVLYSQNDPEGDLLINCSRSSGDEVFEKSHL